MYIYEAKRDEQERWLGIKTILSVLKSWNTNLHKVFTLTLDINKKWILWMGRSVFQDP